MFMSLSISLSPLPPSFPSSVDEDNSVLVPRHLLVFLNPASGQGKTVSDFKRHIQPLVDLMESNYHLIVTGTLYMYVPFYSYFYYLLIFPHTCARGKVISSVVVVISTKIAKSQKVGA